MGEFGLLGVPSSAAAHGPGQEKAPAALRRAGLPERLAAAGARLADYGDLPVARWRPDPHQRRPHNLRAVLDVLRETSRRVGEILADGRVPLVLGGECTVTIAVMAAFQDRGIEPALLYLDGGVDLFTPATNPTGILDSMGVAHLLGEPGPPPSWPVSARPGPCSATTGCCCSATPTTRVPSMRCSAAGTLPGCRPSGSVAAPNRRPRKPWRGWARRPTGSCSTLTSTWSTSSTCRSRTSRCTTRA